ncbi:histidine kinase [Acinetobacter sp. S40]|uniref:ATP-binding protein n=1 Tax=unclassified Acinetobacter TaxID=196816 RepID=UPI00190C9B61|nr:MULTISPECIES: ATP-binding protein [unclassified Acinetobacter]MBJ9984715.1 histidine kinase [Acinetobacter sp. S40]MBK0062480.1 histidine kinase [Acinetobacter sp. S55]MBK0066284.1 histidine kinase [Acinetobacter sp. S54]
MKFWQHWFKNRTHSNDLESMQKTLFACQFDLFCAQLELQLAQMQNVSEQIPLFLEHLHQQIPHFFSEQKIQYCLVFCYPFTQECFIYHAQTEQMNRSDIELIQQTLLNNSVYVQQSDRHVAQEMAILSYQSKLLLTGHDILVWRLYRFLSPVELPFNFMQLLDQALGKGLEVWLQQQKKLHQILLEERKDVAAELHDSIAQILGFLRLKSAQLHRQCKDNAQYTEIQDVTEELASYTHYAYQQTRELITASRLAYQELDFSLALKKVIQEFEHQSSISFELDNRIPQFKVTAKQAVQLLYIIRESLSNIVRHSHASLAQIRLDYLASGELQIRIADDGRGLDLSQKRSDSFGLDIMRERAERIGAELSFSVNFPQGTCVLLKLNAYS